MPPVAGTPVIVGRRAEIAQLSALSEQAASGRGVAVVLEGEPGVGKTTVLDALSAECDRLGVRVLRGAAEDLEQQLPFAAIGACLGLRHAAPESELAHVAAMLRGEDVLGRSSAAVNHDLAVTEEILDLVERWCAGGPVALVVDDAQWADPSSLLVLHRLGHSVEEQPLLLVIATRPAVAEEPVTGLIRSLNAHGARTVRLGPLDEPAVATLVEQILGAPAGGGLLKIVAGAGGNPMYVTELVGALFREGVVQVTDGVADVSDQAIEAKPGWMPRSLVEAILQQLEFLPPTAREALQMAAVLGKNIDVSELATVLDTSVMQLWAVVHVAMRVGLVADTGQELVFRHSLIREALAESLPAAVRAAVHLRAGQALAAAGAPVERVAEYLLAGAAIDAQSLDWLIRSADTLIVRAPGLAVDLLRRAGPAATGKAADAVRLRLVRALLWAGQLPAAEQAARAALASELDPGREGALRWLLAQACFRQGHLSDVVATAQEAVTSPLVTEAEKGRFHGLSAICYLFQQRLDAMEAAASKATVAGEASGDPIAIGYGRYARAALLQAHGRPSEALHAVEQARLVFERGIQPDLQADPDGLRGLCLIELDRLAEADATLAAAVQSNLRTGGAYLALNQVGRATLRLLDGRWDDALAEIETGLDMPDPLGGAEAAFRAIATLVAVHRGTYREPADAVPERRDRPATFLDYLAYWAGALVQETRGQPREAMRILLQPQEGQDAWVLGPLYPDLLRLAVATGDQALVRDLAARTEALAAAEAVPSRRGIALLCRGMADQDPDLLQAAALAFREAGRPLAEGNAYENAATVLAGLGRTAEARQALDRAVSSYDKLDAAWDIGRAEARLRQAGVRRGVHGARKRPKRGWDALTETETRVALLVAEGYSNPDIAAQLFISRRTVQTHVSSILAKLSLSSRVELAVVAAAHR